jgi:hypothetical protein
MTFFLVLILGSLLLAALAPRYGVDSRDLAGAEAARRDKLWSRRR